MVDTERNVEIIKDSKNQNIVLIKNIVFKGRQNIPWDDVEAYLKKFVGEVVEIEDGLDLVYIGKDFPDEFSGSDYTAKLKGALAKAKANAAQGIPELIRAAFNKRYKRNMAVKHQRDAKYGWYRFNIKFALPVLDEKGEVMRYNVFCAELLLRHSENQKLYLYDLINIKKETGTPLELPEPCGKKLASLKS